MSNTRLYTVIFEYAGGTYVAQVASDSPPAALKAWASQLQDAELSKVQITREELREIVESDEPVALEGCTGVWCATGSTAKGLALINIVATKK